MILANVNDGRHVGAMSNCYDEVLFEPAYQVV